MANAFVLGNGRSRLAVDLHRLKSHGPIYGCNALYREFEPDVLIAADKAISEQIQHSGYAKTHVMYTRKPIDGLGAKRIPADYWGNSSGPIAVACAAIDRHSSIFMLGFDLGGINDRFNNVYADTEFYKKSSDRPTYTGNWIQQIIKIAKNFPHSTFIRVEGPETSPVPKFSEAKNIESMPISQFLTVFGQ